MIRRNGTIGWLLPFVLVCLLSVLPTHAVNAPRDVEAPEQVARTFLIALARKDMATCRTFLPSSSQDLFGPFPFVGVPRLSQLFVRGNQGMAAWEGQPVNSALPTRGTLLFRKTDGKSGVWKVRQICYFSEMPALLKAQVSCRYETAADRKAEATLHALGELFLHAWAEGRYDDVQANWYDWSRVDRSHEIKFNITVTETTLKASAHGEALLSVAFIPKTPLFHQTYYGTLTLVQEANGWKVRGSYLEFYTAKHGPSAVPPGKKSY
jgi:hypothetical protein